MQFLGAIKKVASLGAFIQNAHVAEKSNRFGCQRTKIGLSPNVLHILRVHEQGQICTYGFMCKICLKKKFRRF
jgi:hypothetical protein